MRARTNSADLNCPGATRIVGIITAAIVAVTWAAEPVGARDLNGKIAAQAAAASVSQQPRSVKKRRAGRRSRGMVGIFIPIPIIHPVPIISKPMPPTPASPKATIPIPPTLTASALAVHSGTVVSATIIDAIAARPKLSANW